MKLKAIYEEMKNVIMLTHSILNNLQSKVQELASDKTLQKIEKMVKIAELLENTYRGSKGTIFVYRSPNNRTLCAYELTVGDKKEKKIDVSPIKILIILEQLI